MGSSAKKKREKKKDFQKPKLKVGKARPKNTNATDTSFTARSIVIKQQSLTEANRDSHAVFNHNLSLLSSKNETQRRDSLSFLGNHISAHPADLPQPASSILAKSLPLILDGNPGIRSQVLKLVRVLPVDELGSLDQALLYIRAGLTHLSVDIRLHTLDLLDWLLSVQGEQLVSSTGGWIRFLKTFQNLLSWTTASATVAGASGKWSNVKPTSSGLSSSSKLFVHQLSTLAVLLTAGLQQHTSTQFTQAHWPFWHVDAHALPVRSNAFGYLSLFGDMKDSDNEMYESAQERAEAFVESGLLDAFMVGIDNTRKDGGETGRAAASVAKAIKLVGNG